MAQEGGAHDLERSEEDAWTEERMVAFITLQAIKQEGFFSDSDPFELDNKFSYDSISTSAMIWLVRNFVIYGLHPTGRQAVEIINFISNGKLRFCNIFACLEWMTDAEQGFWNESTEEGLVAEYEEQFPRERKKKYATASHFLGTAGRLVMDGANKFAADARDRIAHYRSKKRHFEEGFQKGKDHDERDVRRLVSLIESLNELSSIMKEEPEFSDLEDSERSKRKKARTS